VTEENSAPKVRRFAGTPAQIRSASTFYKVASYITGVMLLLLCAEMVVKYFWHLEPFIGGTLLDGSSNAVGLVNRADITEGVNVSLAILIAHGWLYVVYLLADFRLWSLMRWPFSRFITIALGGVVPLLSFFMEKKVHGEVETELASHPQAAKRY
jgi:integral membrane protein